MEKNTKQEKQNNISDFCVVQNSCSQCKSRGGCDNYSVFKSGKTYSGSIVKVLKQKKNNSNKDVEEYEEIELSPKRWMNV